MRNRTRMKKSAASSSTLLHWMLSYLFVLGLPLVFGAVIYLFSMNTIKQEAEEIQFQAVDRSVQEMKAMMDNLSRMGAVLVSDDKIADLGRVEDGNFNTLQRLAFGDVNKMLLDYAVSNDAVTNVFLYFPKSEYLIGSSSLVYTYNERMVRNSLKITGEEFNEVLSDQFYRRLYVVKSEGGGISCFFAYCNSAGKPVGEQNVVMFVLLDSAKLLDTIRLPGAESFLLLSDGSYLGTSDTLEDRCLNAAAGMQDALYQYVSVGKEHVVRSRVPDYDLFLLHRIPKDLFMSKLEKSKVIILIYVVLCLIVGCLLAGFLTRRNYSPVDELLRMTQKGNYKSKFQDSDFRSIMDSVEKLIRVYDSQEEEKLSREYQIRSNRMRRILENNRYAAVSEEEFKKLTSHFTYDSYLLLCCNISDISDVFLDEEKLISEDTIRLIHFVIENVCAELLEGRYPYLSGDMGEDSIYLLNVDGKKKEEEICADAAEIAGRVGKFLKESYGLNLWINISRVHADRSGIALCRDEIIDMTLFRDWVGTDRMVLCYSELQQKDEIANVGTWFKEKQARDFIRTHSYQDAITLLQELDAGEQKKEAEACEAGRNETRNVGSLMQEVAGYIDGHFTDKMLSAGMLSDIFEMSPSNLSQTFKRKMNTGLLDYINQARLEKAKELLKGGMTVKDAADAVGFYTTRPLIRVFYSVEGVSPAEYRARFTGGGTNGKSGETEKKS